MIENKNEMQAKAAKSLKMMDYLRLSSLRSSDVEYIFTFDCCLNLFSPDHIAQSEANANAKYGISLVCSGNNFNAPDSNFLNSDLGITSIISDSNAKDIINSKPPMPQNLQIFSFNMYNSSNAKSGTISFASLRYADLSIFLVKDSGLKKENNIEASTTTNLISNTFYEVIPYLLAKLSLYSLTNFEKSSSDSLLFASTLSTALNKSNTLSLSSTAPLNNAFVAGFSSSSPIISLNLSGISTVNLPILSPKEHREEGYIKLTLDFSNSNISFAKKQQTIADLVFEHAGINWEMSENLINDCDDSNAAVC